MPLWNRLLGAKRPEREWHNSIRKDSWTANLVIDSLTIT
jgi:hypothetical protein